LIISIILVFSGMLLGFCVAGYNYYISIQEHNIPGLLVFGLVIFLLGFILALFYILIRTFLKVQKSIRSGATDIPLRDQTWP
jgi:hypothetical protein